MVEWAQESMDEEMLGEYEVAECLTDGELSEKLEDRGVAFDAAVEDDEGWIVQEQRTGWWSCKERRWGGAQVSSPMTSLILRV